MNQGPAFLTDLDRFGFDAEGTESVGLVEPLGREIRLQDRQLKEPCLGPRSSLLENGLYKLPPHSSSLEPGEHGHSEERALVPSPWPGVKAKPNDSGKGAFDEGSKDELFGVGFI